MLPAVLQMKRRHINTGYPAEILLASIVVATFWIWTPSFGADEFDFEGGSIRVYVIWDGSYRAFRWNKEGLAKIKNPPRPDDLRRRTNVFKPLGDERSSDLPQELLLPDRRLDVPFAVSRDGRMVVSAVRNRGLTLLVSQELAVIDLGARKVLHLVKTEYYIESVTWSPTGRHFAMLLKENVTKQLWRGPLDLLGGLIGHPRSYYTLHAVIYTLDGKITCRRTIAKNLLNGGGYIDWE